MRILGIDPGSNYLGLGCVETSGRSLRWIGHVVVPVSAESKELSHRLRMIFTAVEDAIVSWAPQAVSVEEVFLAKNAQSALKLGQARGAALSAAARLSLPIYEYPAVVVKKSVTGAGHADKTQVHHMVKVLLGASLTQEITRSDASDALAIAICHSQHRHQIELLRKSQEKRLGASNL